MVAAGNVRDPLTSAVLVVFVSCTPTNFQDDLVKNADRPVKALFTVELSGVAGCLHPPYAHAEIGPMVSSAALPASRVGAVTLFERMTPKAMYQYIIRG